MEEAALSLGACTAAGDEVPFEVVAQPSRAHRTPLYCYRPLTGEFIREHSAPLSALSTYPGAVAAIGEIDGIGRYVLARGAAHAPVEARERARAALRLLLEDVFDGQSDFELRPEQLRAALDRLAENVRPDGDPVTLIGTLHGLTLSSPQLTLARGLTLAAPDAIEGAPEEAVALGADGTPHVLAVLVAEGDDPEEAAADGAAMLRDLVRALRLFGDGRIALGALGWSNVGGGSWRPVALGTGGRPRGMLVVTTEQEDELRAFCSLVARRRAARRRGGLGTRALPPRLRARQRSHGAQRLPARIARPAGARGPRERPAPRAPGGDLRPARRASGAGRARAAGDGRSSVR